MTKTSASRKRLKNVLAISGGFLVLLLLAAAVLILTEPETMPVVSYSANPDLTTILPPERWKGTPTDEKGAFVNHEFPFYPHFRDLIKWQTERNAYREQKKNDPFQLTVVKDDSFLQTDKDVIVWLGHATFFIRVNGVSLLIDPVFGNVGPVKRRSALPVAPEKLRNIDYVLVSHNHRDHCDEASLKIVSENNPKAAYLTGLKMEGLLRGFTKSTNIQAAGWYQQYQTDTSKIKVFYLPSRHWARRGLLDVNTQLWGAYVIQAGNTTIYFSGDTGYGSHLKEAGELFAGIDYCIIGVGAFEPRWFMSPSHIAPDDAVKAFGEMRAKTMIPMHYGTFDLSDEPVGEPARILKQMEGEGKINGELKILNVGEILPVGDNR
jgi:L-ascorbate metabolism protein UlaG (beta-lactamase superfamily)